MIQSVVTGICCLFARHENATAKVDIPYLMVPLKKMLPSNESSGAEPHLRSYRWLILAVVWLLYAAFGLSSRSIPPVVTPMLRDLNMSYGEMGFILGTWQLVYIPVAVFAGVAITARSTDSGT